MTVARFVQPNVTTQSGMNYRNNIDAAIAVLARIGQWFAPHQVYAGSPNPDLAVELDAGFIWDGSTFTEIPVQTVSGFTIPSAGQNRIDRVVVDQITGVASRVAGTAVTGSPTATAPAIPSGKLPVCQVYLTSADTVVSDSMIRDERTFLTSPASSITMGTAVNLAVGSPGETQVNYSIASGTRRFSFNISNLSSVGNGAYIIQLGDSGGIENSGYDGVVTTQVGTVTSRTDSAIIADPNSASIALSGSIEFVLIDSATNLWAWTGILRVSATAIYKCAGAKSLTGELDRVRLTTVTGDIFDSGIVNIQSQR